MNSYETDVISSLTQAIRNLDSLEETLNALNDNIKILERLAAALEENNCLLKQNLFNNELSRKRVK